MAYNYHYDIATSKKKVILKLIFKWKSSIWKAIYQDLIIWCILYTFTSIIYRFALSRSGQDTFERFMMFCNRRVDSIPINFMLGFFVTAVISRWTTQFVNLGMIDNIALFTSMFLKGKDEKSRMMRRNIVRYCVMSQAMVFRDIHIGVRKRFPSRETMVAAGLMTSTDLKKYESVENRYAKYWLSINWCMALLNEARREGRIECNYSQNAIAQEIKTFRSGLSLIWLYDWVPLPLMYPQLVFMAVHCYYLICIFSRQFVINADATNATEIDLVVPFMTIIEFIFYMGWLKVAMDLLNPFGEDEDDFDCNFLIDRNLSVGMSIVDDSNEDPPTIEKDMFWNDTVSPLYSEQAAQRNVNFYFGSATNADTQIPSDVHEITMIPHPLNQKLDKMYGRGRNRKPVASIVELKREQRLLTETSENRLKVTLDKMLHRIHSNSVTEDSKNRALTDEPQGSQRRATSAHTNPTFILEVDEPEEDKREKEQNKFNKRESVNSVTRSRSFNHFAEHSDYKHHYQK